MLYLYYCYLWSMNRRNQAQGYPWTADFVESLRQTIVHRLAKVQYYANAQEDASRYFTATER